MRRCMEAWTDSGRLDSEQGAGDHPRSRVILQRSVTIDEDYDTS